MKFGVNTWVWTSPLTTTELEKLAPLVAGVGFDWIEVPLESLDDLDPAQSAAIIQEYSLGVSACAAMGPDRDLIHPDESIRANGMNYIRGAILATQKLGTTNLVDPIIGWEHTFVYEIHHLLDAIVNDKSIAPYGADFLDGYKNAVICDGILESARSKRQVDLKY